jgi:hypothetical protein
MKFEQSYPIDPISIFKIGFVGLHLGIYPYPASGTQDGYITSIVFFLFYVQILSLLD